jgi:hypothetical protein
MSAVVSVIFEKEEIEELRNGNGTGTMTRITVTGGE